MQIVERWEGADLKVAKGKLFEPYKAVLNEHQIKSAATPKDKELMLRQISRTKVDSIHISSSDNYNAIFEVCSLLETLGYAVKQKYIREDDIIKLLNAPIITTDNLLGGHIEALREKEPTMYENFLFLAHAARNRSR